MSSKKMIQPSLNSKLAIKNKKLKEFLGESSVKLLEISTDDVIKFALAFLGIIFFLHISATISWLPSNAIIALATTFMGIILSLYIFKML